MQINSDWWLCLFTLLVFSACTHDPILDESLDNGDSDNGGNNTDTVLFGGIPCDPDSVYFVNEVLPFLTASCAQPGCHDVNTAEDGVVLDNYFNIVTTGDVDPFNPNGSEIYETITDSDPEDRMPPAGEDPLTSSQIQLIYDWISQGAQDNSCNSCDTNQVTFSQTIFPIVELKCQGCHSGNQPSGSLSLIDYDDISQIALTGAFIGSVNGSNGYTLMPYNSNALPPCEVDLIQSWIDAGAPNN